MSDTVTRSGKTLFISSYLVICTFSHKSEMKKKRLFELEMKNDNNIETEMSVYKQIAK